MTFCYLCNFVLHYKNPLETATAEQCGSLSRLDCLYLYVFQHVWAKFRSDFMNYCP